MMVSHDSKIYVYKLTTDNGGAPCVFDKILSLAICKNAIRSTICKNDWLIGFGGRSTIGERLIFVAKITEKIIEGNYYKSDEYFDRPDCIYRWDGQEHKYVWVKSKKYHKNGDYLENDLGKANNKYNKANVLLSNQFSYLGCEGNEDYKTTYQAIKKLIENLRRNFRINHDEKLKSELIELIKSEMIDKKICLSTQLPDDNICHDQDKECIQLIR